ncbi:MAG: RHS repeat-associated core domain-containing protein [Planctomycetota bacterium]
MSDFGRRYCSATLGRWINRDPIGDFGGANVYAYVGNNPTNRTDYLGMMYIPCPPGEPCHEQGPEMPGRTLAEPGGPEENDKMPCPRRQSLVAGRSFSVPPLAMWWPREPQCPLPPPASPGNCSDCWATCNSAEGQAMSPAVALGYVLCRPDGCKCACVNQGALQGVGGPQARRVIGTCVTQHEEFHVSDSGSEPGGFAACPPRQLRSNDPGTAWRRRGPAGQSSRRVPCLRS